MENIKFYNPNSVPSLSELDAINDFLYAHLEQYGDPKDEIRQAINYALAKEGKPGGLIAVQFEQQKIIGAVVLNKTGMKGYIPENILVYIATHHERRGKGIGKRMMQGVIDKVDGNIALHVEPNNPAKFLYEKLGFTNPYLEMRLIRKG